VQLLIPQRQSGPPPPDVWREVVVSLWGGRHQSVDTRKRASERTIDSSMVMLRVEARHRYLRCHLVVVAALGLAAVFLGEGFLRPVARVCVR
jgi:hypothetical protein